VSTSIPVQVATGTVWSKVSSGYKHTIAIKEDGTLWGWGWNFFGQVGDGTNGKDTPNDKSDDSITTTTQIDSNNSWLEVSGGAWFSTALQNNGAIYTWGYNNHGQLGNNTSGEGTRADSPQPIITDTHFTNVYAGHAQAIAIKDDGTLWGWGFNGKGSLGDGTTEDKTTPTQLGTESDWHSIFVGYEHTLAIKEDGTLWLWGRNDYGQIGDGTKENKTSPIQIGNDKDWYIVRGGGMHSLAIKRDGSLWAWGRNDYGQLGDGTNTDRITPVQIGTDTDWQMVDGGFYFSIAMKSNGEVWAWGHNDYGQLGDGTFSDSNKPVKAANLDLTDNQVPIADAGSDLTVNEGDTVTLDGSNSSDPDGTIVSYDWVQTSGSSVVISDTTSSKISFTAPSIDTDSETLAFILTVKDDKGFFNSDAVNVTVSNVISKADLKITSLKIPRKVKRGRKAVFKCIVKNVGSFGASSTELSFYLSKDNSSQILSEDILLGTKKVKKMKKGKIRVLKKKWKIPRKFKKGSFYLKAYCDSKDSVEESNEDNNLKVSKKRMKIVK
ncbi:MAG: hypothetical protein D6734_06760, partial [Candidatus Schekmanbacteria bacterium]